VFLKPCGVCGQSEAMEWTSELNQSDKTKAQCHSCGAQTKERSVVIYDENQLARKPIFKYFRLEKTFPLYFVSEVTGPLITEIIQSHRN